MTAYALVKFLHVLMAITAVGSNITYGIWQAQAARDPRNLGFTLRVIKILDDRVANPAYGMLLLTGLGLLALGRIPWTTPWVLSTLILYFILVIVALRSYTPLLRRQVEVVNSAGPQSPEFQQLSARGRTIGITLGVIVILIVFFMVTKTQLW